MDLIVIIEYENCIIIIQIIGIISDLQTRWNSSYYMLQSLLEQKRALSVYTAERTLPATLTAHQWELMIKTAEVLAPFEELTRDVSRETASAADVIPTITGNFYLLFYFGTCLKQSTRYPIHLFIH